MTDNRPVETKQFAVRTVGEASRPGPQFAVRSPQSALRRLADFIVALRKSGTSPTGLLGPAVVAGVLLLGKAFAFLREVLVARLFGVSSVVDAYVVGTNALGLTTWLGFALQLAVVPIFVEARERRSANYAGRVLTSVLWIATGAGLLMSVVILVGADLLVRIVAPGLVPETARQAAAMIRIMAPMGLAAVVAAAAAGYLNANRRFAVARLYQPAVALASLTLLVPIGKSRGLIGLAGSQSFGYVFAGALLLFWVRRELRVAEALKPIVAQLFRLGWPTLVALVLFQANSVVNKIFVSMLPTGSVAALGYAERLYQLPVTLMLATIVTFHYTHAAELAARGQIAALAHRTGRNVANSALLLVPLSVGIAALARPLVRIAFQRGAFDQAATRVTAAVLAVYCLALLPNIVMEILAATMRGLGSVKGPMFAGVATIVVNVSLCALLVRRMGAPGAAAAMVGAYLAGAIMMIVQTLLKFRQAQRREKVGGGN